jgi:archaeosine synthase
MNYNSLDNKFAYIYGNESEFNGNGCIINPELCFYEPKQIKKALTENRNILTWLKFISEDYIPDRKKILLIYPCSTIKPYNKSRSYSALFKTINNLEQLRNDVHLVTISEPFGLVPEEFYGKNTKWHNWADDWYDCPGLYEWWCTKYGLPYDSIDAQECINILANYISNFLKRVDKLGIYVKKIALVRTYSSNLEQKIDHIHRRIIEIACNKSKSSIEILPDYHMVEKVVRERGKFAWDMYGVAHPLIQEILYDRLKNILR